MHSRRPPSLRHKGYRRELQKSAAQHEPDHDDMEKQLQPSIASGNLVVSTRKTRRTGFCTIRILALFLVFLALFSYAKFVLSTTSLLRLKVSEGDFGRDYNQTSGKQVDTDEVQQQQTFERTKGVVSNVDAEKIHTEKAEEQEWKDLVKDQTARLQ